MIYTYMKIYEYIYRAAGRGQLQRAVEIAARPELPRAVSPYLTECIHLSVLESQFPHKIVDVWSTITD